jgi:hypothetical protein
LWRWKADGDRSVSFSVAGSGFSAKDLVRCKLDRAVAVSGVCGDINEPWGGGGSHNSSIFLELAAERRPV